MSINLMNSVVYPSLLSAQKSIAFDTTMAGSEGNTIRATLNDRIDEFKQELAIFCVDEGEEEKDLSDSSISLQNIKEKDSKSKSLSSN